MRSTLTLQIFLAADVIDDLFFDGVIEHAVDREIAAARILLRVGKSHLRRMSAVEVAAFGAERGNLNLHILYQNDNNAKLCANLDRAMEKF